MKGQLGYWEATGRLLGGYWEATERLFLFFEFVNVAMHTFLKKNGITDERYRGISARRPDRDSRMDIAVPLRSERSEAKRSESHGKAVLTMPTAASAHTHTHTQIQQI